MYAGVRGPKLGGVKGRKAGRLKAVLTKILGAGRSSDGQAGCSRQ